MTQNNGVGKLPACGDTVAVVQQFGRLLDSVTLTRWPVRFAPLVLTATIGSHITPPSYLVGKLQYTR